MRLITTDRRASSVRSNLGSSSFVLKQGVQYRSTIHLREKARHDEPNFARTVVGGAHEHQQSKVNFIKVLEKVDFPCRAAPCRATVHLNSTFSRSSMIDSGLVGEVSRGEKMALRATDSTSYITEYALV